MRDLNDLQRLAILQALYNALGAEVSTKDPDNLRGRVDAELVELNERTGAKSFDVAFGGQRVGSYSVSAGTEGSVEPALEIHDPDACDAWMLEQGYAHVETRIVYDKNEAALLEDGELPDGCTLGSRVVPGKAPRTTLRGCSVKPTVTRSGKQTYAGVLDALGDSARDAVLQVLSLPDGGEDGEDRQLHD